MQDIECEMLDIWYPYRPWIGVCGCYFSVPKSPGDLVTPVTRLAGRVGCLGLVGEVGLEVS